MTLFETATLTLATWRSLSRRSTPRGAVLCGAHSFRYLRPPRRG